MYWMNLNRNIFRVGYLSLLDFSLSNVSYLRSPAALLLSLPVPFPLRCPGKLATNLFSFEPSLPLATLAPSPLISTIKTHFWFRFPICYACYQKPSFSTESPSLPLRQQNAH